MATHVLGRREWLDGPQPRVPRCPGCYRGWPDPKTAGCVCVTVAAGTPRLVSLGFGSLGRALQREGAQHAWWELPGTLTDADVAEERNEGLTASRGLLVLSKLPS